MITYTRCATCYSAETRPKGAVDSSAPEPLRRWMLPITNGFLDLLLSSDPISLLGDTTLVPGDARGMIEPIELSAIASLNAMQRCFKCRRSEPETEIVISHHSIWKFGWFLNF